MRQREAMLRHNPVLRDLVHRLRGVAPNPPAPHSPVTPPPVGAGLSGQLDFVSRKLVFGWAAPPEGAAHATIEIVADGQTIATVVADRHRADLAPLLGRTDLSFIVPLDLPRDDRPIVVEARFRGGAALPGSPRTLPPISAVETVDNPVWYRDTTRAFLRWRFEEAAFMGGVYNGHQPLYGFGVGPCEPGWLERYTITHAIMQELGRIDFRSLVDIGGADGYKGAMIREVFGADVLSADLSPEACRLAEAIYRLKTKPVAMEQLPFEDESFDVVLCSESLEHVSQPTLSTAELLRVARKAVVITVPAEPLEQVAASVQSGEAHAHINWFGLDSFDYLRPALHAIETRPILSTLPAWRQAGHSIEALVTATGGDTEVQRAGQAAIEGLVEIDGVLTRREHGFNGMIALLKKQPCTRDPAIVVPIKRIIDFKVPPYRKPETAI